MEKVAAGVTQLQIQRFVNVYFVEVGLAGEWVLVDTGLPGSTQAILSAANELFYPGTHPQAILLTHGHMDHAGSAQELAEHWQVPVLAHPLELPFLTGRAVYPPADPTVEGGGSLAFASRFFPPQSFQLGDLVQALPTDDNSVPYLPEWRWVHVPGHAPGQLALFREADRTLLAGDAFATANHESLPALLMQQPRISVAGAPFNYNWPEVHDSVQRLASLRPEAIGCGHGPVITGPEAAAGLQALADNFPMPTHGRYAAEPAILDAGGVQHLPPAPEDNFGAKVAMVGAGAALAFGALALLSGRASKRRNRYETSYQRRYRNGELEEMPELDSASYPYKEVRY